MEDLLASIRKAINEDIGGDAQPVQAPVPQKAAAEPRETAARVIPEAPASGNEIQQLREKITRSRTGDSAPRDPMQRAASLAAALRSETPRRAWRDFEPPPPQQQPAQPPPRLRSSILDGEPPRPALKPETPPPRPMPRYTAERQPTLSWPTEPTPAPAPATPPQPAAREPERVEPEVDPAILSGGSAQAVQTAFSRLADTVLSRATGDRSIEDMTRELLRGMLKQWLDENLPELVERLVREEIERVVRTGR